MAAINLWIKNLAASGSSHGQLVDVDPNTNVTTGTGWTTDTATGYSLQIWNTKRASSTFGATALPSAAPSTSDCWRSVNTYNGTIAAGAWTLACIFSSVAGSGVTIAGRFRVWRSANADGSSATEITSGTVEGNAVSVDSGNNISTVTTGSLGSVTLTNEYIFLQVAAHITVAGAASSDALLSYWTTALGAKNVITPNFTPSSSFVGDEDFFNPTFNSPGRAGLVSTPIRGYAAQDLAIDDDEAPAGNLFGMSADDPNDSWFGSVYLPGLARSSKAAVAASLLAFVATSLPLRVSADEQIPAGNLYAVPDEVDEEPVLQPWPTLPVRRLYLPDADDAAPLAPAGVVDDDGLPAWPPVRPIGNRGLYQFDSEDVRLFGPEEEYGSPAQSRSQWWPIALEMPYDPDPEELPAGALFGVPEEDTWALVSARSTSQRSLYLPDADDFTAVTAATIVDDDYLVPVARTGLVNRALYAPDAEDVLAAAFDEEAFPSPSISTRVTANRPAYLPDVQESIFNFLIVDEEYSSKFTRFTAVSQPLYLRGDESGSFGFSMSSDPGTPIDDYYPSPIFLPTRARNISLLVFDDGSAPNTVGLIDPRAADERITGMVAAATSLSGMAPDSTVVVDSMQSTSIDGSVSSTTTIIGKSE